MSRELGPRRKGDVIEVAITGDRFAYFQDLGLDHGMGLVRFLPGEYDAPLRGESLAALVAAETLYVGYCDVRYLLEDEGFSFIANVPVPEGEDHSPVAVTAAIWGDWREWWVRDSDGTESQGADYVLEHPDVIVEHLPRANEYPSAAEVRARIEAGWRPWNRVPVEFDHPAREPLPGGHIEEPRTIYLTYFSSRDAAERFAAAAAIQENKLSIGVPQHDEYGKWAVSVERAGYFNRRLDAKLHALAEEFGGIYDGDVDISR
jgi:hypothetical protein